MLMILLTVKFCGIRLLLAITEYERRIRGLSVVRKILWLLDRHIIS